MYYTALGAGVYITDDPASGKCTPVPKFSKTDTSGDTDRNFPEGTKHLLQYEPAVSDDIDDLIEEELAEEQSRRLRSRHKSRRIDAGSDQTIQQLLAQSDGLADLITSYQPSRHERGWLLSSLRDFYDQGLISDVLGAVKGGKEASVYRCRTSPRSLEIVGSDLVAAKVYRPRAFRNLRNDAQYRQGRAVLTAEGTAVKRTDTRILRAMNKKSEYGVQVQHTSWLMYEYTTLAMLHQAGAAVPRPIAASENSLLMEFIGDVKTAAPSLIETTPPASEAAALLDEVLRNISLLLSLGWIHGDLSAYNILYWNGKITLIDFPQVANREGNPDAEAIFRRDIERVCDYFSRLGVRCNSDRIANQLWTA